MITKTLAAAVAFLSLSLNVHALNLGKAQVDSKLGELLDLSMQIGSIDEHQFSTLQISLAPREMFSEAGMHYPDNNSIHIELGAYTNGQAILRVRTTDAVNQPFLQLLMEIAWSGGKLVRVINVLIDPADYPAEQALSPAPLEPGPKPVDPVAAAVTEAATESTSLFLYWPCRSLTLPDNSYPSLLPVKKSHVTTVLSPSEPYWMLAFPVMTKLCCPKVRLPRTGLRHCTHPALPVARSGQGD